MSKRTSKVSSPPPLSSAKHSPKHSPEYPRRGLRDWYDLIIADHGFLRLWFENLYAIRPGVWRSAQPTPRRIKAAAQKRGIRTVVNLRGARSDGGWRLEKEACDRYGITLVDFTIRSRAVPDRAVIAEADSLFKRIEYPVLLHCKSGADRTGIMAALYLLLMEDATAQEAAAQLALKYGHVRTAKTGLLDAFIAEYEEAEARGITFADWVKNDLDPEAIEKKFLSRRWANLLVDKILRRE